MIILRNAFDAFTTPETLTFFFQVVFTALLVGLLGLERERKGQAAGLRTHIVVGLGSMLAMSLSFYLCAHYPNTAVDRIPAQVISGIGFLGAGAILHYGVSIKGLTTAAGLWASAIIGLAVGAGYYIAAAILALGIFFVIAFLELLEKKMKYTWHTVLISLQYRGKGMDAQKILSTFKDFDVSFSSTQISGPSENRTCVVEFRLKRFKPIHLDKILEDIRGWDSVENIVVKREDK